MFAAPPFALGLDLRHADRIELLVCDLPLARAIYGGSPAARLLARTRLGSDELELAEEDAAVAPTSTWDGLVRALNHDSRARLDLVKRAVARHTRAASVEGPLHASPAVIATLVAAVAASGDSDASLAEIAAAKLDVARATSDAFARACAAYDARLGDSTIDLRGALFEACIRLTARATLPSIGRDDAIIAFAMLSKIHGEPLPRRLATPIFPRDSDPEIGADARRMALVDRADLDVLVARDPRDLAAAIVRCESEPEAHLDTFVADLGRLLATPGPLALAMPPAASRMTTSIPSVAPPGALASWIPETWSDERTPARFADAIERGVTTAPRARVAVAHGGEPALDAIGAEMLRVAVHPFASAVFAEILATRARPRDIVRIVTYFALAPDPALAASALSACTAPELPRVLAAWLEAMLPSDGVIAPTGDDPNRSSSARLRACIAALTPYPQLHDAVAPLMKRLSDAPPALRTLATQGARSRSPSGDRDRDPRAASKS